jgi:hypothetical protein
VGERGGSTSRPVFPSSASYVSRAVDPLYSAVRDFRASVEV